QHGTVDCLDTCAVEILDARGSLCARVEFPRNVFAAFALARGIHLVARAGDSVQASVAYALHASAGDDEPFQVALPAFTQMSLADLTTSATVRGVPDAEWIATFISPEVAGGLQTLAALSRLAGVEMAARIHTRAGYDGARHCFVRVLEQLVISAATQA